MYSERIFINNIDISEFGAKALRDSIQVGGTEIKNDYFQGRNRTNYTLMSTTFGLKPVKFTLVYIHKYLRGALENKSKCEAEMIKGCEVYFPSDFYYRCMIDKIGDATIKGVDGNQVLVEVKYALLGIQHDKMEEVENGAEFVARGTMPQMDCILEVVVGADAPSYTLAGAVFGAVVAGDVLTVDGINKRFLKNGAHTTADSWVSFPYITSGLNHVTAADPVKVKYYPCYL